MPIKISRTLFVGLGGTGVKSILRTKQCFMDAYGEIPPMIAFLAIDTDKAIRDMRLISRSGKEVKLTDNEICFMGVTNAIDIYRNNMTQFQWLPKKNIDFLANLRNTGAGQIRSNGRFLARFNATDIVTRVASKITEIGQPVAIDGRFTYDTNKDGVEYPVKVNVVGSVAGGTGSGTMLDVLVLIAKSLRNSGMPYSITPWIVLPEVFRHIAPGPASINVFQNAYGALRELDYLYHLPQNNPNAIDFDFDKVYTLDEGITNAYLINNTNTAGIVLQNVDDITDSIGRCMFLPSNEVSSIWDNTTAAGFVYNIRDKKANYVSAGSAEIVYDNKAVGQVIAKNIVVDICDELCKKPSRVAVQQDVIAWTMSPSVSIQEHDADLLIDSLLAKYAPFSIILDKDSDVNTVNANIVAGAEADNVISEVTNNTQNKLSQVKALLKTKVSEVLNAVDGVGSAKEFIKELASNIERCKEEMNQEVENLAKILAYNIDWNAELSTLRTGLFNRFNADAAEVLQTKIAEHIATKRDLLRHNWAIQFYTDLEAYIKEISDKLDVFKGNLEAICDKQSKDIKDIQQLAMSSSKFQIYLHKDDVCILPKNDVAQLSALFRANTPIDSLLNESKEEIYKKLYLFAKQQQVVIDAVNVTIEQKLQAMSESHPQQVRNIFAKVKDMSSVLWTTNTQGFLQHAQTLTKVFTIGVFNQSQGIIQSNYLDEFTIGSTKPVFAGTHQTDRITFFQSVCFSPLYAVNNMLGYMREAAENLKKETHPVYYLDEKWNQRMIVEGFDIMPKQQKDRVLPNWVNAIIFGFIKFDEEHKSYCIESDQGDILSGGLLELGPRRDMAFEQFQLRGIDKEVEERIQQMILDMGRPAVNEVMKKAKNNLRSYVTSYAQLSAIELDRVNAKDPAYKMVRDLLENEVGYVKELDI